MLFRSTFSVNKYEGIGFIITLLAFAIIVSPIAHSDSDTYHLKNILQQLQIIFSFDDLTKTKQGFTNNEKLQSEIIMPDGKRIPVTVLIKTITPKLPEDASYWPDQRSTI